MLMDLGGSTGAAAAVWGGGLKPRMVLKSLFYLSDNYADVKAE